MNSTTVVDVTRANTTLLFKLEPIMLLYAPFFDNYRAAVSQKCNIRTTPRVERLILISGIERLNFGLGVRSS